MARREELAETAELSAILKMFEAKIGAIEKRLAAVESGSLYGASKTRQAYALVPGQDEAGKHSAFGGISVSSSSTPASVLLEQKELLLSSVDEQIVQLIRTKGAVCAEEIRAHFKYKGKNAASARLSRLNMLGVLEKQQTGRVVYYKMK